MTQTENINTTEHGLDQTQMADLVQIEKEFIYGCQILNKYQDRPKATFYGAARVDEDDKIYQDTFKLAQTLSELGYVILNGGGPGMMEAATLGAESVNGDTLAISMNIAQEPLQDAADTHIATTVFSVRKYLLRSSEVLIYVPGGIGTLDEMAEVLVLARFNKIPPKKIFLYNSEFWKFLDKWIDQTLINKWGMNYRDYEDLFHIVDSPEEVMAVLDKSMALA